MTAPMEVYEAALRRTSSGGPSQMEFVTEHGVRRTADVGQWCADALHSDEGMLTRCAGLTLDVGCGPGRLAAALNARGVPALGVDVSGLAVRLSRRRGALALRRDVFDPLPGEGRWRHLLLADGNVGIGGDPVRLLRRCRALVTRRGTVLVETDRPGAGGGAVRLRLRADGRSSTTFDWAFVAADAIADYAAEAELRVVETWTDTGRWFTVLAPDRRRADHGTSRAARPRPDQGSWHGRWQAGRRAHRFTGWG